MANETKAYGSITITDVTDGKSAYELWLEQGNEGTEEEYLASLKGDTGRGIDQEITLYYAVQSTSGIPTTPQTPDIQPESASYWVEKIPSQWKPPLFGNDTYIFTTVKKLWNDGGVTYTPPVLMSQIEAATMAARDSKKTLAEWCAENNVTIIDGSTIATGTITANQIQAETITAEQIAADTITGEKIAAKTIKADNIAADAITAEKIKTGAITTEKIDANAVTTAKLDAEAVTAAKIAANAITTEKIDANAVTTQKIASEAITADKINVNDLLVNETFSVAIAGKRNYFKGFGVEEIELYNYNNRGSFRQFDDQLTFNPAETVDQYYTISMYAKSPNGETPLYIYNSNNPKPRHFYFSETLTDSLGTEWQYVKCTIQNTDLGEEYTDENCNRIEIYAPEQMGVLVKKIKVEVGQEATTWTPAPEDGFDNVVTSINASPSGVVISGDKVEITGNTTFKSLSDAFNGVTATEDNETVINGGRILTNSITAEQLSTNAITSRNYYKKDAEGKYTTELSGEGSKLDLATGAWDSQYFKVNKDGEITATGGNIAGWTLRGTSLIGETPGGAIMGLFTNYKGLPNSTDINATMTNTTLKVGNSESQNNWRILIGNRTGFNFGVDGEGKLYATNANISGTITADGGQIADWTLKKTNGEKSLSSGTIGSTGVHFFTSFPNDKACQAGGSDIKNNWRILVASNFGVDSSGILYAKGANISGTITAESGKIGGWEIQNDSGVYGPSITYGTFGQSGSFHMYTKPQTGTLTGLNGQMGVNRNDWLLGIGHSFGVTSGGALYAYRGNIAGIEISEDNLTWTKDGKLVSLISGTLSQGIARSVGNSGPKNDWFIWSKKISDNGSTVGSFGVDATGTLYATGANISGTITASTIIGSTFTNSSGSFEIDSNGNITGSKITGSSFEAKDDNGSVQFSVTNTGYLTANRGSIAGWKIDSTSLTKGDFGTSGIHLYSWPHYYAEEVFGEKNGKWVLGIGSAFGVTDDGTVYANKGKLGEIDVGNIAAKEGKNTDGGGNGFGWQLNTDGFYLNKYSNDNPEQVFYVNENEAKVGGFNITKNNLSTGSGSGYISLQTSGDNYEYTPAEYIESNGNQYIDTGVKPTPNTVTEIVFTPTGGLKENAIFGSKWAAAGYFLMLYNGTLRWHSQGKVYDTITVSAGDRLVCKCSINGIEVNGVTYNTPTDDYGYSLDAANNIQLLGKMDSTGDKEGIGRIESCRIYESGKIIRNFTPAFKEGEYGLYDLCFGQFYKNKNTNYRFNGQLNVEQAEIISLGGSKYTRLEYIQNNGSNNYIEIPSLNITKKNGFIVEVEFEPTQNTTSSPDNRCCLFSNYSSSNGTSTGSNISLELHQNNLARGYIDNGDRLGSGVAGTLANQRNKVVYTVTQEGSLYSINCLVNGQASTRLSFSPSNSDDTWRGPFRIFVDGYNGGRFETFKIPFKLYSIKVYSNGKKLFHGLPVLNSSNVPGLVDLSSGQFFTTPSGSAFAHGEYELRSGKVILGAGEDSGNSYRTLEYIESSGTQYINTGVKGDTSDLTIMAKYNILAHTRYAGIFGNYVDEPYNCWRTILTEADDDEGFVSVNTLAGGGSTRLRMPKNTILETLLDKDKIVINNQTIPITNKKTGIDNDSTIAIFSQKVGSTGAAMRLYSFKILNGGALVRDYVPVIQNEDKYGLYDLVEQKFYSNEGTGVFTGKDYVSEYHAIYLGDAEPELAPFSVTNTGKLKAGAGSIGGWEITEDGIMIFDENQLSVVGLYSGESLQSTTPESSDLVPVRIASGISTVQNVLEGKIYQNNNSDNQIEVILDTESQKKYLNIKKDDYTYSFSDFEYSSTEIVSYHDGTPIPGNTSVYQKTTKLEYSLGAVEVLKIEVKRRGQPYFFEYDVTSKGISISFLSSNTQNASEEFQVKIRYRYQDGQITATPRYEDKYIKSILLKGFSKERGSALLSINHSFYENAYKVLSDGTFIAQNAYLSGNIVGGGTFAGTLSDCDGVFKGELVSTGGSVGDFVFDKENLDNLKGFSVQGDTLNSEIIHATTLITERLKDADDSTVFDFYPNPGTETLTLKKEALAVEEGTISWGKPTDYGEISITVGLYDSNGNQVVARKDYQFKIKRTYKEFIAYLLGVKEQTFEDIKYLRAGSSGTTFTVSELGYISYYVPAANIIEGHKQQYGHLHSIEITCVSEDSKGLGGLEEQTITVIQPSNPSIKLVQAGRTIVPSGNGVTLGRNGPGQIWSEVWASSYKTPQNSDGRLKNSILVPNEKYEAFYDCLNPITFCYNKSPGIVYHGFVAQEVEKAMESSGLDAKNSSLIHLPNSETGIEYYGLQYDQFISLNTWQIQKLKPRVSSLEQTILEYETRISNLESQLKNLTS